MNCSRCPLQLMLPTRNCTAGITSGPLGKHEPVLYNSPLYLLESVCEHKQIGPIRLDYSTSQSQTPNSSSPPSMSSSYSDHSGCSQCSVSCIQYVQNPRPTALHQTTNYFNNQFNLVCPENSNGSIDSTESVNQEDVSKQQLHLLCNQSMVTSYGHSNQ